jgi:Leucine-rich repeat (LRR) protein
MFVKKDLRKVRGILEDTEDDRRDVHLARRVSEFPQGTIRSVLCRPTQVERLSNLVNLSLYGNELVSVGGIGALGACVHLRSLDLGRNKLSELPLELAELRSLTSLVADDNALVAIDEGVLRLSGLEELRLSGNAIRAVPRGIGALTSLRVLALDNNHIVSLPEELGDLSALETLNVRQNRLGALPSSLGRLAALRALLASSNELSAFLPGPVVARLTRLETLTLNGNRIEWLPEELALLRQAKLVNVANNCIEEVPPAVLDALPSINVFGQRARATSPEHAAAEQAQSQPDPAMDIEDLA